MGLCYWATLSTLARQFSVDNDLMTSSWVRKLHHGPSQYGCANFDDPVRVLRGRVLPSHHIIVTGSSIEFSYHYFGGKISL